MKNYEVVQFALCLDNQNYPASLEVGKLYRVITDADAAEEGLLRVIDESGEDYAFTSNRFHMVELPLSVRKTLMRFSASQAP